MACKLIKIDYNTRFAIFSIDKEADLDNLPLTDRSGKGELNTLYPVSQGSKAMRTDGVNYILSGDSNKWIKQIYSSGGGGSGGGGTDIPPDGVIADESDIDSLFSDDNSGSGSGAGISDPNDGVADESDIDGLF